MVGAVRSSVHVAVRDVVDVLPQISVAVKVLVCERIHPLLLIDPVLTVTVGVPQASVAVADPSAASIAADVGLHPSGASLPVVVIVGAVRSSVQVAVLDVVAVLPQISVAVNVLVCERIHPLLLIVPLLTVTVGVPQASVAVADPSAASIAAAVGLHPSGASLPVAVMVGAVRSSVHVAVLDVVAVLPQISVAVNVLVCDLIHPFLLIVPVVVVTVGVPQASVAVADPSAASIAAAVGLHPSGASLPVAVMVGAVRSSVQVAVLDVVAVLPQISVAVNVLVCDLIHPLLLIDPVLTVTVGVPQASVAVALPSAASIAAAVGLHPSGASLPVAVIVGAVRSSVQVAVLDVVAVLPQISVAVNVLVCERKHPLDCIVPVVVVTVGVPQASVAVALPSAASIAAAAGLHPSGASLPVAVIVGAVRSSVQVAVLDVVAVLPQISVAVNVLVCERIHPLDCIVPVLTVTVGVPQASVAVALPSAASIAAAAGLHPSGASLPVAVIVGAVRSSVQVAVLDVVAVLPQISVAVNVLVCERKHPLLLIDPVLTVTVGVPQASVAVALPSAASIAAAVGLHSSCASLPVAVIVGTVRSSVHVAVLDVVAVLPQISVAVNILVCERKHPLD